MATPRGSVVKDDPVQVPTVAAMALGATSLKNSRSVLVQSLGKAVSPFFSDPTNNQPERKRPDFCAPTIES
jgi:hypothetical protein